MIALIQRVSEASVVVDGDVVGDIGKGLLVLLGVEKDDDEVKAKRLMEKVTTYRVFGDEDGKMNLNVNQFIYAVDFCVQICRIVILFIPSYCIKRRIEHADNFR